MFSTTVDSISEELGDMFPMHAYVITARLYYINCNKFWMVLILDKMLVRKLIKIETFCDWKILPPIFFHYKIGFNCNNQHNFTKI